MRDFGTAAILCGGKSTRMGFDKSGIKIKDKLLVEIIAEELEQVFDEIILISNDREKFKNTKYMVAEDIIPGSGPAGGIYTALSHASSRYVFVTACDMPIIKLNYIGYMMDIIKEKKVQGVAARNNRQQIEPLYAFYSIDMINSFRDELEKNNCRIIEALKNSSMYYVEAEKVREYCGDMSVFTNMNYQSDLSFLEKVFNK